MFGNIFIVCSTSCCFSFNPTIMSQRVQDSKTGKQSVNSRSKSISFGITKQIELDPVVANIGNRLRDRVQNTTESSKEWQRDVSPFSIVLSSVLQMRECSSVTEQCALDPEDSYKDKQDPHNFEISDGLHIEKVFFNTRQKKIHSEDIRTLMKGVNGKIMIMWIW